VREITANRPALCVLLVSSRNHVWTLQHARLDSFSLALGTFPFSNFLTAYTRNIEIRVLASRIVSQVRSSCPILRFRTITCRCYFIDRLIFYIYFIRCFISSINFVFIVNRGYQNFASWSISFDLLPIWKSLLLFFLFFFRFHYETFKIDLKLNFRNIVDLFTKWI